MSLYNILHGFNENAPRLLEILRLEPGNIPRFRDCYLTPEYIVVYTRTGGGNREAYEDANADLTYHPLYVRDEDADDDATYAKFYFRFPDEHAEELKALAGDTGDASPEEKFAEFMDKLRGMNG